MQAHRLVSRAWQRFYKGLVGLPTIERWYAGRKDSSPDATSARLEESPDGPKYDPELNPTAGNTQIQSRPGNWECQDATWIKALRIGNEHGTGWVELSHVHGNSGKQRPGERQAGKTGHAAEHASSCGARPKKNIATRKTRRALGMGRRASVHCSSRALNRTTDRLDYAFGRGAPDFR